MADSLITLLKRLLPDWLVRPLLPAYHYLLAAYGALRFGRPSKRITVVGVTGTKGKSSVTEILNAICKEAGMKTAMANSIRFTITNTEKRNRFKMTMPGRFFLQRFLREAVKKHCDIAIVEMTSEGVKQFRHKFIHLDALIFTNIEREHIEAHGSFENYVAAKLQLRDALARSSKRPRIIVANRDDAYGSTFLDVPVEVRLSYGLADAEPYELAPDGITFTFRGVAIHSPLVGAFNLSNILAAATYASHAGIATPTIARAVADLSEIRGRVQRIEAGQPFTVVVDYAHTPESLRGLYTAFADYARRICVLGNTGGGRDTWKRPEMGAIADAHCDTVILTNEDPYDEDPHAIVAEMARGMRRSPTIIMDRRKAIRAALLQAQAGDAVLISGKGTDPYIMGPDGAKEPWDDATIVHEELERLT